MAEYMITEVRPGEKYIQAQIDALLLKEGIRRDANLDYTCAMFDDDYNVIATGSCFGNTLRCIAVSGEHQGEGLLGRLVSHLMRVQAARGNLQLFLYTKVSSAPFFADLGFYEIARAEPALVFMENRRDGFARYLDGLKSDLPAGDTVLPAAGGSVSAAPAAVHTISVASGSAGTGPVYDAAAVVMNANPFTLGHQYLAETAAAACKTLHLFVVSEDASLVPTDVRRRLVLEGTAHIPNVVLHDSGPYMISNATFPSYFLKDEAAVISGHARLDTSVFTAIAHALGIGARFVGEEPASEVTGIYNRIMSEELPKAGIACHVIPRREVSGVPVSASAVRECLKRSDWDMLRTLVPETTLRYFRSPGAEPVLEKIRSAENVVHY